MIFSTDSNFIRLAGCIPDSSVDGPGVRYVLFFQGCAHACPGCHNPSTHAWDNDEAEDCPVETILENFKETAVAPRVTISGGEPFGQPQALLNLLMGLRKLNVDDIWLYTGYRFSELNEDTLRKEILKYVSTVVTGRFKKNKTQGAPLFAGSTNQKIIKLSGGF